MFSIKVLISNLILAYQKIIKTQVSRKLDSSLEFSIFLVQCVNQSYFIKSLTFIKFYLFIKLRFFIKTLNFVTFLYN